MGTGPFVNQIRPAKAVRSSSRHGGRRPDDTDPRTSTGLQDETADHLLARKRIGDKENRCIQRPCDGRHASKVPQHARPGINSRRALGRGLDVGQLKLTQRDIVSRERVFTLEDVDLDRLLVVDHGGDQLGLLRGDGGVLLDELRKAPPLNLDTEGEVGHVEQGDGLDLALEDAAVDGGADCNDLVRVEALVEVASEQPLDQLLLFLDF